MKSHQKSYFSIDTQQSVNDLKTITNQIFLKKQIYFRMITYTLYKKNFDKEYRYTIKYTK